MAIILCGPSLAFEATRFLATRPEVPRIASRRPRLAHGSRRNGLSCRSARGCSWVFLTQAHPQTKSRRDSSAGSGTCGTATRYPMMPPARPSVLDAPTWLTANPKAWLASAASGLWRAVIGPHRRTDRPGDLDQLPDWRQSRV